VARTFSRTHKIVRTQPASYYSSQSKEERARNARNHMSMLRDKPMVRVPNRMKVNSMKKRSSGGAGG
jgi:hypothetical protein